MFKAPKRHRRFSARAYPQIVALAKPEKNNCFLSAVIEAVGYTPEEPGIVIEAEIVKWC